MNISYNFAEDKGYDIFYDYQASTIVLLSVSFFRQYRIKNIFSENEIFLKNERLTILVRLVETLI